MSPLDTVERLMPPEYHTGGLHDDDPLVRLVWVGHAMGYLEARGWYQECAIVTPQELLEALHALRSQAQREAGRGHA